MEAIPKVLDSVWIQSFWESNFESSYVSNCFDAFGCIEIYKLKRVGSVISFVSRKPDPHALSEQNAIEQPMSNTDSTFFS